jgi:undecaprenyl-diphosphatase
MIQAMIATVHGWDDGICLRLSRRKAKRALDGLMAFASWLGDGYLYPAAALALIAFDSSTAARLVPAMALAFALELPIQKILKHKTRRARPYLKIPGMRLLVKPPADFSFPSGHTTAAFLTASLVGQAYPFLLAPCLAAAGLIGMSRVYNGVHYPSDVLAGVILGTVSAQAAVGILH